MRSPYMSTHPRDVIRNALDRKADYVRALEASAENFAYTTSHMGYIAELKRAYANLAVIAENNEPFIALDKIMAHMRLWLPAFQIACDLLDIPHAERGYMIEYAVKRYWYVTE